MTTVIWTAQLAGLSRSWDPVKSAGALRPMTHAKVYHSPVFVVIPYRVNPKGVRGLLRFSRPVLLQLPAPEPAPGRAERCGTTVRAYFSVGDDLTFKLSYVTISIPPSSAS